MLSMIVFHLLPPMFSQIEFEMLFFKVIVSEKFYSTNIKKNNPKFFK